MNPGPSTVGSVVADTARETREPGALLTIPECEASLRNVDRLLPGAGKGVPPGACRDAPTWEEPGEWRCAARAEQLAELQLCGGYWMTLVATYMDKGPQDIDWSLVRNEDGDTPLAVQRARHLLVPKDATKDELTRLLRWYYGKLRSEAMASPAPHKKIFIYVYPTRTRATAGLGEWIAMASAVGEGDLPETVEPQFKLAEPSSESPSAKEDAVYDDLMAEFVKNPPASDEDEMRVMKRVATRHRISVKALDAIYLRVTVHRQGK